MTRPKKLAREQVLAAIEESRGILARAARTLNVSRTTLYAYLDEDEDLKAALEAARESVVDDLEDAAIELALSGDSVTMMTFLLERLGRKRGYGKQPERAANAVIVLDLLPPPADEPDDEPDDP